VRGARPSRLLLPAAGRLESAAGDLGLASKRNALVSKLSGGQRQRLFIALALVGQPDLVFLDELTSGLDPQARRLTWDLVKQIRDSGVTAAPARISVLVLVTRLGHNRRRKPGGARDASTPRAGFR
jgi:ABC-type cobalamin/Fe3+-siderophores transport system ATPase subunit